MTDPTPSWRITWGDHSFTDLDVLAADDVLMGLDGEPEAWHSVTPPQSARRFIALAATVLARRSGRSRDDLAAEMATAPEWRLLAAVELIG